MLQRYGSEWREIKEVFDREEVDGPELNEDDDIEVSPNATDDEEDLSFEVPEECKQYLNQSVDQLMESTEQGIDISLHAKMLFFNILTEIKTRSIFLQTGVNKSQTNIPCECKKGKTTKHFSRIQPPDNPKSFPRYSL